MATTDTLSSGICPRCGSNDVYKNSQKRGDRVQLAVSSTMAYFLDTYLCLQCGHFEEAIPPEELKNEKMLSKIRESWRKV